MNDRLTNLREALAAQELDGILITQPENRRYLSGFTGSAGVLVVTQDRASLATDFRYYEQVKAQAHGWELVPVTDSLIKTLAEHVMGLGAAKLGFESQHLTVHIHREWIQAMGAVEWIPTSGMVETLRQIKSEEEIDATIEAIGIADDAMAHIYEWLRPGVTEREVAWELEVHMRTHGAEALSFTTIVGSGPNGAMSHAVTSERQIQVGDPIVIDMGAVYHGYCSDLTRSFCLGVADGFYRSVWNTVLEAQLEAEKGIVGGMSGIEADALARDIIYAAGHTGRFGHGLGHGVGLAIHESPRASRAYPGEIPSGSLLTVEPGVYIPDWGGIRIEDMVVVREEGCQVLTQVPKLPVVGTRYAK